LIDCYHIIDPIVFFSLFPHTGQLGRDDRALCILQPIENKYRRESSASAAEALPAPLNRKGTSIRIRYA